MSRQCFLAYDYLSGVDKVIMANADSKPSDHPHRLRILIVDDDRMVAHALLRVLRVEFDAVAVGSMRDALALLLERERFDAIICDVMMSSGSGADFYEELAKRHPECTHRVIFITGGIVTGRERRLIESIDNPCLTKPVDIAKLRVLLRKMGEPTRPGV